MRPVVLALAALAAVASTAQTLPDVALLSAADLATSASPPDLLGFEPPDGWVRTCGPCPSNEFESVEMIGPDSTLVVLGFMPLPDKGNAPEDVFAALALSVVTRSAVLQARADTTGSLRFGPVILETVGGRPWLSATTESDAYTIRMGVAKTEGGVLTSFAEQGTGRTWTGADRVLAALGAGYQQVAPLPGDRRVLLVRSDLSPAVVSPAEGAVTLEDPTSTYTLTLPEGWHRPEGSSGIDAVAPDSCTTIRVEYDSFQPEAKPDGRMEGLEPLAALYTVARSVYDSAERANDSLRVRVEPFALRTVGGRRWLTGAVSYTLPGGEPYGTAEVSYARVPGGSVSITARWSAASGREHVDRALEGFAVRLRSASCGGVDVSAGVRLAVPGGFERVEGAPRKGLALVRRYDLKEYDWWEPDSDGDDGLRTDSVSFIARQLTSVEAELELDSLATRVTRDVLRPGEETRGRSGWRRIDATDAEVVHASVERERSFDTSASVFVVRIEDRVVVGRAQDGNGGSIWTGHLELLANRLAVCETRD
ncbi:hypothetical protein [Rubrivirga sp.]|uniref:hypothetical protein n=1 Tax=Rubrivirga sp. TaxID=1885344 RepID=UPI003C795135